MAAVGLIQCSAAMRAAMALAVLANNLGVLWVAIGLGFWLGLTDASIGDPGHFVGLANFISASYAGRH